MKGPRQALIGDDILAALAGLGIEPVHAEPIAGLAEGQGPRATLRVTATDGRVVKARRLLTSSRARRLVAVVTLLSHDRLPRVLARVGPVTIEAWVDGTPLSMLPCDEGRLARAADLLADFHASALRAVTARSTGPLLRRSESELRLLEDREEITPAERGDLVARLRRFAPDEAAFGIVHNDFCAENLVEDAGGRIHAIDNEHMGRGFLAFDMARARYRWPMSDESWQCFTGSYARRHRPPDPRHVPFWQIAAISRSAWVRAIRRGVSAALPVRRLRTLSRIGRATGSG